MLHCEWINEEWQQHTMHHSGMGHTYANCIKHSGILCHSHSWKTYCIGSDVANAFGEQASEHSPYNPTVHSTIDGQSTKATPFPIWMSHPSPTSNAGKPDFAGSISHIDAQSEFLVQLDQYYGKQYMFGTPVHINSLESRIRRGKYMTTR